MPFCAMSRSAALQDVTPLENVFIQEYMLRAPGDYVKVYLYGLMHCRYPEAADDTPEAFARALGLEENAIHEAYAYWQRRGLVRMRTTPVFAVEYRLVREVMLECAPGERHLYDLAAFNQAVQDLFGQRLFRDFERVYDWFDTYHFSEEVALRLIQYCVAQKGKNVRIAYMDSVARAWADAGITTPEQAEDYITGCRLAASQAKMVLTHIGLKRRPTVDEDTLYAKWTREWNFPLDAILLACKEMTRIQNPNFQYIDRVLANYRSMGLSSAQQVEAYMDRKGERQQSLITLYHTLGLKGTPGAPVVERYNRWLTEWGFTPQAVLEAARYVALKRPSTLDALESLLESFFKLGVISYDSVTLTLQSRQEADDELLLLFSRLGLSRTPSSAERAALQKWRESWGLPLELVLYAAEIAIGADRPFAFVQKVLSNWREQGITTVGAARAASAGASAARPAGATAAAQPQGAKTTPRSLRYAQRTYTEEQLDALIMPLDKE